jgi:hypothetical protein
MPSKANSWRDCINIHPAAELFPLMSESELRELGEDILKHGLCEGVALIDGSDGKRMLLDGRNRLDAMEMIGVKLVSNGQPDWARIPFRNVKGADPFAFVLSKNIHRRHLTAEQRRELIEELIKRQPEKSDRKIADEAKSNRNTVGRIRVQLEKAGDVSRSDTRTDRKGRKQAAHKSPTKSAAVMATDRAEARAEHAALEARIVELEGDLAHERFEHDATRSFYHRALDEREGIWSRAEFINVLFCLHPDTFNQADKERRETAWLLVNEYAQWLLKKGERDPLPPDRLTREDLAAMKRQATAERKAKRAARKPSPHKIEDRTDGHPQRRVS